MERTLSLLAVLFAPLLDYARRWLDADRVFAAALGRAEAEGREERKVEDSPPAVPPEVSGTPDADGVPVAVPFILISAPDLEPVEVQTPGGITPPEDAPAPLPPVGGGEELPPLFVRVGEGRGARYLPAPADRPADTITYTREGLPSGRTAYREHRPGGRADADRPEPRRPHRRTGRRVDPGVGRVR